MMRGYLRDIFNPLFPTRCATLGSKHSGAILREKLRSNLCIDFTDQSHSLYRYMSQLASRHLLTISHWSFWASVLGPLSQLKKMLENSKVCWQLSIQFSRRVWRESCRVKALRLTLWK